MRYPRRLFFHPRTMKRLDHPPLWRNWSGTVRCKQNHRAEPVTLEEIQAEVVRATDEGERLRVIASGASLPPLFVFADNHPYLRRSSDPQTVAWRGAGVLVERTSVV